MPKGKWDIWTLPNIISFFRVALMPVFIYLLLKGYNVSAVIILIVAAITDLLDGYIARLRKTTSKFGAVVDGVCDKLFAIPAGAAIFYIFRLKVWEITLIFIRDIFVIILVFVLIIATPSKRVLLKSAFFGKLATVLQYLAMSIIVLDLRFQTELITLVAIVSVIAVIQYTFFNKGRY